MATYDGDSTDNSYTGTSDPDTINGNGGNDTLIGAGGDDTIDGGDGSDRLRGVAGDDTLTGGDGVDLLDGGADKDMLYGGGGDDLLYVGDVADFVAGEVYDGGSGYDTLRITIGAPVLTFIDLTGVTLTSIEKLERLSSHNQAVLLTRAQLAGFQWVEGSIGIADGGAVSMAGVTVGNNGYFTLSTAGNVFDLTGALSPTGTVQGYRVQGQQGDDTITGSAGDDELRGSGGANILNGAGGEDHLYGGSDDDQLSGGDQDDVLDGSYGNDQLFGGAGADVLDGGGENDWLDGGTGADAMAGGAADDTYVVDDVGDTITELAGPGHGNDTVRTSLASYTLGANVEQLVYTGAGSFTGTGTDRNNVLTGGALGDTLKGMAGADTLNGGGGDDSLDGGTGIDAMYGGAGDDTYMVDDSADQVIEVAGEGTADTVRSSAMSYTLGADVENLTLIGGLSSTGIGNAFDNVLIGNGSHNILDGGAGADRMEGGNGNDTYKVDNANDLVIETGAGLDTVIASVSYVLRAGVTVETLTTDNDAGTAAINLTGNELANRVVGNAANNTLHGGAGNDRLEGLDGADILWGDAGQDLLIGGNGNDLYVMTDTLDTTIETATGGNDRVSLSLSGGGVFTLGNYIETLVVAGTATEAHGNSQANTIVNSGTGNSLYGEGGNDTMSGGAAAEAFHGGAGNDRITAGAGDDTLWGDAGNDVFVFATGSGADEVGDFTHAADKIDLSGWGVTSFSEVQGMMSQSGADTFIDLGGGHSITLDNVTSTTLDANDFLYASAIHSAAVFSVEEASDAMMRSAMLPLGECRCTGGPATFSMLADI